MEINLEQNKMPFDLQEEKSLYYLSKILNINRESMTVFLPYNKVQALNRKHRSCLNYLKLNKGYTIQWEIA